MIWSAMFLAVAVAVLAAACMGFALAGEVYGYPVGVNPVQWVRRRRDERRFRVADLRELEEAFARVLHE